MAFGTLAPSSAPAVEQGEFISDIPLPANQGLQASHWFIAVVGILVVMHFVGMSKNTRIDPAHIEIGGYNVITITLIALIGVTGSKILFNKVYVPGLTELVNAA